MKNNPKVQMKVRCSLPALHWGQSSFISVLDIDIWVIFSPTWRIRTSPMTTCPDCCDSWNWGVAKMMASRQWRARCRGGVAVLRRGLHRSCRKGGSQWSEHLWQHKPNIKAPNIVDWVNKHTEPNPYPMIKNTQIHTQNLPNIQQKDWEAQLSLLSPK